jgi:aminopeptidase N
MLSILLSLACLQGTGASGGELIPEQAAFDVQHYALVLEVDPEHESIQGTLTMRALATGPAARIALDLDSRLAVTGVAAAPRAAEWRHEAGRIWIDLTPALEPGDDFSIEVAYGGAPRVAPRPPWDGGFTWAQTKRGAPWITTSCQGEGADLWWPCKDHPSDKPETMDIVVALPEGLFCASNGVLVEDRVEGGLRRLHWRVSNPISNYCVALNIAPYEVIETTYVSVTGEDVPVFFWHLPESAKKAAEALPEFLDHLRFLEELCGPYPFRNEKYGIAETPHLGMEHQTVIAYGNRFRAGPFGYDWLHHHELSHEWWANLVTCRDWKDMWLHEGFGTYMQALYNERTLGQEGLTEFMRQKRRALRNRRAVAPRESMDSKEIYFSADGGFDNDIYDKGAFVLHALRWVMGDEAFFVALRRMAYPVPALEQVTDGSQVRFVDTEDFRRIAEQAHGADLGWFFEVYLRQPDLPRLEVVREGDELVLTWQPPVAVEFPVPVPLVVGGVAQRVELPGGTARVPLDGEEYELDPDLWLLRER